MLKACKYCGGIHRFNERCKLQPDRNKNYKRQKDIQTFRNSKEWRLKREDILLRDKGLCLACWYNFRGTLHRINSIDISIHHIEPLVKAWWRRLDDDNLASLCPYHHEQAEKGGISADEIERIVRLGIKISPPHPKA